MPNIGKIRPYINGILGASKPALGQTGDLSSRPFAQATSDQASSRQAELTFYGALTNKFFAENAHLNRFLNPTTRCMTPTWIGHIGFA
jgi:hypothetical protein